jgi:hypothetical protein
MKIGYIKPNKLLYGTLVLFVEKKKENYECALIISP